MRATVLYDNSARQDYAADWGFACLLEDEETVLLDTGDSPDLLAANMDTAGVDPRDITKVVLSHDHHDHTGGLPYVVSRNPDVRVILLPSFGPSARSVASRPGVVCEVTGPQELAPGLHSTGPVPNRTDEQAVWFEAAGGLVMVTGCAHPGLDTLLARLPADRHVHAVLGGFHGFDRLDALEGIDVIAPCHCTKQKEQIAARFPNAFRATAAGDVIEFAGTA
jgi:7,8-dihydropterin-6-yl-methyl-4-(beta-D-ribofuranosyl)aminobenzene 5'-phosphate synthase